MVNDATLGVRVGAPREAPELVRRPREQGKILGRKLFVVCRGRDWRRQWHPTRVLLPGISHGWRSLVGCSPWGHGGSDTTERLHFHASEKEMATHSSAISWRIPGTREPGGLPSAGSHRVRHD